MKMEKKPLFLSQVVAPSQQPLQSHRKGTWNSATSPRHVTLGMVGLLEAYEVQSGLEFI